MRLLLLYFYVYALNIIDKPSLLKFCNKLTSHFKILLKLRFSLLFSNLCRVICNMYVSFESIFEFVSVFNTHRNRSALFIFVRIYAFHHFLELCLCYAFL